MADGQSLTARDWDGYRERRWDTRVGEIELQIPGLRTGSYLPSFLEPRRRAEQALVAVVQEAYEIADPVVSDLAVTDKAHAACSPRSATLRERP